jgi:hypothetical protein
VRKSQSIFPEQSATFGRLALSFFCSQIIHACGDWKWLPDYDVDRFFDEYFLPEIRKRYGK